jgi:hypothetical protein
VEALKEMGAAKTNTKTPRSTGLKMNGVLNFNKKELTILTPTLLQ